MNTAQTIQSVSNLQKTLEMWKDLKVWAEQLGDFSLAKRAEYEVEDFTKRIERIRQLAQPKPRIAIG